MTQYLLTISEQTKRSIRHSLVPVFRSSHQDDHRHSSETIEENISNKYRNFEKEFDLMDSQPDLKTDSPLKTT